MKIVCNSTALIALSRIGHLWLLESIFGRLIIPAAVYNDVVVCGEGKPGARDVDEAAWIHVRAANDMNAVEELCSVLHRGEAEAIILAREISADLIILDDDSARRTASMKGLRVVGTLSLLRQAKEKGLIPALKPLFDALTSAGFYMGKERDEILSEEGELQV